MQVRILTEKDIDAHQETELTLLDTGKTFNGREIYLCSVDGGCQDKDVLRRYHLYFSARSVKANTSLSSPLQCKERQS